MQYKPYRCGKDCRGGYYCFICLFVYNTRKLLKKFKKILSRKTVVEKTDK